MYEEGQSKVAFDILLKGESSDLTSAPANIDSFRPPAKDIEHCYRWLSQRGVTCHRTDFGLVCEANTDLFEQLFNVTIDKIDSENSGHVFFKAKTDPVPPKAIEQMVLQITIARPPTLFENM